MIPTIDRIVIDCFVVGTSAVSMDRRYDPFVEVEKNGEPVCFVRVRA